MEGGGGGREGGRERGEGVGFREGRNGENGQWGDGRGGRQGAHIPTPMHTLSHTHLLTH